jgi:hypothetical protein
VKNAVERSYIIGRWLIAKLYGDPELLRTLMGGTLGVAPDGAMTVLEREGRRFGWARGDIVEALQRIGAAPTSLRRAQASAG